jgi:16S rRNA G966 N2-methylase RsmD
LKFFLYVFYFFRSAFLRGFINTIRLLKAEVDFEKKFGIKTSAIKKSDSSEFFHYQGASYLVLLRIFKNLDPRLKQFQFVDIGSGKGRVIFVAEASGFTKLKGIELDEELANQARQNANRYVLHNPNSFLEFITANALEYRYANEPAIYFLFNPFNAEVLRMVLSKIKTDSSQETWFIYMNPLYRQVFDELGADLISEIKTKRYLEAVIYKWPT